MERQQRTGGKRRTVLTAVLLGLLVAGQVFGASLYWAPSYEVEDALAVPLVFEAGSGERVSSLQFTVAFDAERYALLDVLPGPRAVGADKDVVFSGRGGRVSIIVAGLNQRTIAAGELATLYLLPEEAGFGAPELRISGVVLSNPDGQAVPWQPASEEDGEEDGEEDETAAPGDAESQPGADETSGAESEMSDEGGSASPRGTSNSVAGGAPVLPAQPRAEAPIEPRSTPGIEGAARNEGVIARLLSALMARDRAARHAEKSARRIEQSARQPDQQQPSGNESLQNAGPSPLHANRFPFVSLKDDELNREKATGDTQDATLAELQAPLEAPAGEGTEPLADGRMPDIFPAREGGGKAWSAWPGAQALGGLAAGIAAALFFLFGDAGWGWLRNHVLRKH